jgi:uncharacterized repeat protein (TIGR01451 family)
MVDRSSHRSRHRARLAFGSLFAGLVLALSIGSFASAAGADDESDTPSPSGDVAAAAAEQPDPPETANNPAPDHCGLNMVLVLDRSGSTKPADPQYQAAANAFVDSFVGTPSHIGLVTFATSAVVSSGYSDVSSSGATLKGIIDSLPMPEGFTNWQDAFVNTAGTEFDGASVATPRPDLVVFITDGNPTTQNGNAYATDLGAGIAAATALKGNGLTHVTGVAVGDNIDISTDNIAKITGPGGVIDPSSNVKPGYDVYQPPTPDALKATLAKLTTQICGGTVHVHKQVRTGPGTSFVNGAGWAFTSAHADVADQVTDGSGNTDFGFSFSQTGTAQTITETPQPGYSFEGFTCDGENPTPGTNGFSVTVNSEDDITCTVTNTPSTALLTLNKVTTHGVGGPFDFRVTGGPAAIDETRSATTAQENTSTPAGSVSNLFPGTYNIEESSPEGWDLTGIACVAGTEPVDPPDATGNITLGIGESVTCTYTNDQQATDLSIVKAASGLTPVNGGDDQQIDYTLTVDNHGPADAHTTATVTDVLPSGASLVSTSAPGGVTCSSAGRTITCTIPADQLQVSDPVVIGVRVTVPTNGETVTNTTIVDSPDDPAPCTVASDNITCSEDTNNYSEVSTDVPEVEAVVVTQPPATQPPMPPVTPVAPVAPTEVEAAQVAAAPALAFTGSRSSILVAGIGALLVVVGASALVLSRRRRARSPVAIDESHVLP